MQFGIFDHLDRGPGSIDTFYADRLDVIAAADGAGFRSYHLAEHHLTTLGMAPSPTVFLSAAAQRTERLRLGTMIFAAPLYHPLRLLEEIGMLDQLSKGRFEMGFGRGAVAAEVRFFGLDPKETEDRFKQHVGFILDGLKNGHVTVPSEHGPYLAPLAIPSFQQPHPPLWYGVHSMASAERAALAGMNVMSLDTVEETRPCNAQYFSTWKKAHPDRPTPLAGLGRFIVLASDASDARARADRAYRAWHQSFTALSSRMGFHHIHERPTEFGAMIEEGRAFAGTPENAVDFIRSQMDESGANFFVAQLAFGDLTKMEILETVGHFHSTVIPEIQAFSGQTADAAG